MLLIVILLLFFSTVVILSAVIIRNERYIKKIEKENTELTNSMLRIHELTLIHLFAYFDEKDKEAWLKEQLRKIKDIAFTSIVK